MFPSTNRPTFLDAIAKNFPPHRRQSLNHVSYNAAWTDNVGFMANALVWAEQNVQRGTSVFGYRVAQLGADSFRITHFNKTKNGSRLLIAMNLADGRCVHICERDIQVFRDNYHTRSRDAIEKYEPFLINGNVEWQLTQRVERRLCDTSEFCPMWMSEWTSNIHVKLDQAYDCYRMSMTKRSKPEEALRTFNVIQTWSWLSAEQLLDDSGSRGLLGTLTVTQEQIKLFDEVLAYCSRAEAYLEEFAQKGSTENFIDRTVELLKLQERITATLPDKWRWKPNLREKEILEALNQPVTDLSDLDTWDLSKTAIKYYLELIDE